MFVGKCYIFFMFICNITVLVCCLAFKGCNHFWMPIQYTDAQRYAVDCITPENNVRCAAGIENGRKSRNAVYVSHQSVTKKKETQERAIYKKCARTFESGCAWAIVSENRSERSSKKVYRAYTDSWRELKQRVALCITHRCRSVEQPRVAPSNGLVRIVRL